MRNSQTKVLDLVESGRQTLAAASITPVRDDDPEEELSINAEEFKEECPHGFSLELVKQFLDDELQASEEEILKQQIDSCLRCQEEASELADLIGRGDEFSDKMGWNRS